MHLFQQSKIQFIEGQKLSDTKVYYFCLSSIVSLFLPPLVPSLSFSTLLQHSRPRKTGSCESYLLFSSHRSPFFSPVNICGWAFRTGLISHLRVLMGAEGNWRVNRVTFIPQIFDLRPMFRCGGKMWNSIPHTHRSHTATSQLAHSLLVTMSEISLTACGCGPEFSMRFDTE